MQSLKAMAHLSWRLISVLHRLLLKSRPIMIVMPDSLALNAQFRCALMQVHCCCCCCCVHFLFSLASGHVRHVCEVGQINHQMMDAAPQHASRQRLPPTCASRCCHGACSTTSLLGRAHRPHLLQELLRHAPQKLVSVEGIQASLCHLGAFFLAGLLLDAQAPFE